MLIQINTDKNVEGGEGLIAHFTETLKTILSRFDEQITRVEAHLSDENGKKENGIDKRCTLEAKLKGLNPIVITTHQNTLHQAVKTAAEKMLLSIDKSIEQNRAR